MVETLARRWSIEADGKQLGCLVGHGSIRHTKATLARPQGYMNRSGQPVASLLGYYKAPAGDLLVVHDDMDLPFGELRLKRGGGHRGHNGLRGIIQHIGPDFGRLRIGIGRPPADWDPADFVLAKWTEPEQVALDGLLDAAVDILEDVAEAGFDAAMGRIEGPNSPQPVLHPAPPVGRRASARPTRSSPLDSNPPDAPHRAPEEIS